MKLTRRSSQFFFLLWIVLLAACARQPTAPVPADPLQSLKANPWQWVGFTNPVEQFSVERPQDYLLTFNADGTVNIRADCNNAAGTYTAEASSLKIAVGPMTMAACPPDSHSDRFVQLLGASAIYFFKDGHLFIDLFADSGTLEFAPAQGD